MEAPQRRKTKAELLAEINAAHEKRHALASSLLATIKERREEIARKLDWFKKEKPDLIYRFHHQSYKAFRMVDLIRSGNELIGSLAPESTTVNKWYSDIIRTAVSKEFNAESTKSKLA